MMLSSGSSTGKWKFNVFLSFRGEDTRFGFTDRLYKALIHKGISTFRDEDEIEEGKDISTDLSAAIEASRIALIVVSENYASSRWCLEELSKIFECHHRLGMTVLPIFYKVDPSHVRNQTGTFAESFAKHELRFGEHNPNIQKWRHLLTNLANLKAWLLEPGTHESKVIEEITTVLWKRIKPTLRVTQEHQLVGINSKLTKLSSLLNSNSDEDVIWIGIHGMGGIGKTTLARVCYERIRDKFEAHCFVSNVQEKFETSGLPYLQSQLLSRMFSIENKDIGDVEEGIAMINQAVFQKKILLVLDDVNCSDQIMGLIPNKNSFGNGSRIIITTRNADLLSNEFEVKRMFKMVELTNEEALQLLNLSACPKQDCLEHSKNIVKIVGGHPLALKLLGSSLRNKDLKVWKYVIEELKGGGNIHDKVFKCLKVSYDGLDEWEKEIFLDVACFFKGKRKELVEEILNGCGFHAKIRVELLIQKSLLTLSYHNKLMMHDLLQEMGRKIVRHKPVQDRLWRQKDIKSMVGEASVESILFKSTRNVMEFPISFSRMHQLRLLNFHNVRLKNELEYCIPSELRYLKWKGYPLEILLLNSEECKLIKLHMCHSNLKQFWHGEKHLEELKYIKLNHSRKLFKTPNFETIPNLTRLELEGCISLVNIHPTIFTAKKLTFLSLKDCINLTNFPPQINIKALEILILNGCSKLKKIPEFSGNTSILLELHLDGTSISSLPSSIAILDHLTVLSLTNCKNLINISNALDKITSLKSLNLSGCSKLGNRKRKRGDVETVEFDVRRTTRRTDDGDNIFRKIILWLCKAPTSGIFGIPSLAGLYSLTRLNLSDCKLEEVPEGIECLVSLVHLNLSRNNFSHLPTSISRLHNLKRLNVNECEKLLHFPKLPPRILRLMSKGCISLKDFLDISKVDHSYFMIEMNLMNCFQWVDNKELHKLITSWMQKMLFRKGPFNILVPGCEIPDWFTTKKMGSSICVEWDHDAPNANMVRFALCVICGPSNKKDIIDVPFIIFASVTGKDHNDPNLNNGDLIVGAFNVSGMKKLDHIWMFVLPRTTTLTRKIRNCKEIEFRFVLQFNYNQTVIPNVELKKCGVGLINMEEESEAMKRYASYIIVKNRMKSLLKY
ncbi:TMV resistance protein N-like isoform X1 [Cucurbita pepo subsp. pepo]|uniref:TMV resistance protein N-like isoform X1 n=1 Tax=Cucurbita pepo subsp. pepo TaxID=3664 RepID=UPI000C9D8FE9|nr:TMV resistance protein N-like isoform X1 [Cucurbita pepo subsp. pepo]